MKIKKFRIYYYKSIVDSGDCYLATGVTVLAGKNEAGKSSTLEALEDFDTENSIREDAFSIKNKNNDKKPRISLWFEIDAETLMDIFIEIGFEPSKPVDGNVELCITKDYPNIYTIEADWFDEIGLVKGKNIHAEIEEQFEEIFDDAYRKFSQAKNVALPVLNESNTQDSLNNLEAFENLIKTHTDQLPQGHRDKTKTDEVRTLIAIISAALEGDHMESFKAEVLRYVPTFIMFSSFNDIFPNKISRGELEDDEWISDLKEISNLDVETILSGDDQAKMKHHNDLNIRINKDYEQFWEQDVSELAFYWDNENLLFWIKEDGEFYEPSQRSKGRQWHLAFYIRVSARAKERENNVILIDEPGLYLHAQAQRDILKKLDEAGRDAPVIFTTHSPYLIESDRLERVRLVQKLDDEGTKIENKLQNVADKETLTPIMTAIGVGISEGIVNVDRKNNVVVEGYCDYYYLNSLLRLLGQSKINFVYGGGASNMPSIGTILMGWGCQVLYLYDNDRGYKNALKHIKRDWLTITEQEIEKLQVDGAIEDMFTKGDFAKYVACASEEEIKGKNSDFAKDNDKVLLAKSFLEKCASDEIGVKDLSKETINNFESLINILSEKFSADSADVIDMKQSA